MRLTDVYKKGKVIFLIFERNWVLLAKMGMTGWFYRGADRPLFRSQPNVTFEFENEELHFADFRNFGTLVFTDNVLDVMEEMDRLAPDVLNPYTTFVEIAERVALAKEGKQGKQGKQGLPVGDALMDQTLLMSGIGNILKSEVLYAAGVSPRRELKDVGEDEWRRIVSAAKSVSKKTLAVLERRSGESREEYAELRRVYGKETDPEGRRVVAYQSADGRATYYVPSVQA